MESRKNHVIVTAKELFQARGFNESSIKDIIQLCGISKGTFYNYFSSKNGFMIEYLKAAQQEEYERRNSLLEGNQTKDKDIFIQQILVRMEIGSEYTLRPIYEYAFHSKDKALKHFIDNRLISELGWMAKRLIDLYGEKIIPYATDGAVILHGLLQHMLYVWVTLTKEAPNKTLLAQYIMRRLDDMMANLAGTKDFFFRDVQLWAEEEDHPAATRALLIKELTACHQNLNEGDAELQQHISFMAEEMTLHEPRLHVLRSCLDASIALAGNEDVKKALQNMHPLLDTLK